MIETKVFQYILKLSLFFVIYHTGISGLWAALDYYLEKKGTIKKYKLQPRQTINWELYKRIFIYAFIYYDLLSVIPYITAIVLYYHNINALNLYYYPLPLKKILIKLLMLVIWQDLSFYHIHRMFHLPVFYKWHKRHHSITAPFSISHGYASWIEIVIANILPVVLGPIILDMSLLSTCIWALTGQFVAQFVHSGYKFNIPLLPSYMSANNHDIHHEQQNYWYGSGGLFDYLYSTGN